MLGSRIQRDEKGIIELLPCRISCKCTASCVHIAFSRAVVHKHTRGSKIKH